MGLRVYGLSCAVQRSLELSFKCFMMRALQWFRNRLRPGSRVCGILKVTSGVFGGFKVQGLVWGLVSGIGQVFRVYFSGFQVAF